MLTFLLDSLIITITINIVLQRNDLEFGEMQFDDTVRLLQLEKENLLLQVLLL